MAIRIVQIGYGIPRQTVGNRRLPVVLQSDPGEPASVKRVRTGAYRRAKRS